MFVRRHQSPPARRHPPAELRECCCWVSMPCHLFCCSLQGGVLSAPTYAQQRCLYLWVCGRSWLCLCLARDGIELVGQLQTRCDSGYGCDTQKHLCGRPEEFERALGAVGWVLPVLFFHCELAVYPRCSKAGQRAESVCVLNDPYPVAFCPVSLGMETR